MYIPQAQVLDLDILDKVEAPPDTRDFRFADQGL